MQSASLVTALILTVTGLVHIRSQRPLAILSVGMLVGWLVQEKLWPLAEHHRAWIFAAIVPLLVAYCASLYPRRWLAGLVDFSWAVVIPYAVIILVYRPDQLTPILPVMETFSFLSLAGTLIAAEQARREKQPGAAFLLVSLLTLFVGLYLPTVRAYALGFFALVQALLVSWVRRTRP